jgi:hypothetical protein
MMRAETIFPVDVELRINDNNQTRTLNANTPYDNP